MASQRTLRMPSGQSSNKSDWIKWSWFKWVALLLLGTITLFALWAIFDRDSSVIQSAPQEATVTEKGSILAPAPSLASAVIPTATPVTPPEISLLFTAPGTLPEGSETVRLSPGELSTDFTKEAKALGLMEPGDNRASTFPVLKTSWNVEIRAITISPPMGSYKHIRTIAMVTCSTGKTSMYRLRNNAIIVGLSATPEGILGAAPPAKGRWDIGITPITTCA